MRKPIRIALIAGTAGILTLGGTAAAIAAANDDPSGIRTGTDTGRPASATATYDRTGGAARIGSDAAGRAAQRAVPHATVREIELEHEHGRALWEVDLTRQGREYEVDVDATSGKVLHVDRDDDRGDGRDDDRGRNDVGDDHGHDGAGHDDDHDGD